MKDTVTTKDIARATSKHETTVGRKLVKLGCPFVLVKVLGGQKKHFYVPSLPEDYKEALYKYDLKKEIESNLPVPAPSKQVAKLEPRVLQNYTDLKEWQRLVFDARLLLYNHYKSLKELYKTTKAINKMVAMAKSKTLPENLQQVVEQANARRGKKGRTLSKSMLQSWDREVKKHGIMGLVPAPVKERKIPEWASYFIKCYGTPEKPSINHAMERMEKVLPEGIAMPNYYQVWRFHNKRSKFDRERGRRTGSELKALKGYRKRDVSNLLPMQVGVCDGHSYKAKVAHPVHGNPFKPEICSIVDVVTRVLIGWSVGLAESTLTVGGAIRNTATVNESKPYGGILDILYTDCGSGNKGKVLTDDFAGMLPRIGTTHKTGNPGNPQGHGIIEVLNKTLWVRSAKDLPTFVGKAMDSLVKRDMYLLVNREIKKNGVSQHLPTWPQFLDHCQQSVDAYNMRPHSSLPKINDPETGRRRYMAPLEMWAWHVKQGWKAEDCQLTEQEIEILFLPRIERTIQRSGVRLFTNYYFNKILEHYEGASVQVGYDIHDGERVQIWDGEGRMICWAIFEKNRDSFFPVAEVEMASNKRAKQRAKIKLEQLGEIESERRGVIDVVAAKATVIDINAASTAITVDKEALQQEMAAQTSSVQIPEDDKGKYVFWNALDVRVAEGEDLTREEQAFYAAYVNSTSYKAFKSVEQNLGQQQVQ